MKRKILTVFIALVATICCALGLAACNGGDDAPPQPDPPPAPHTHVWSQTYTADGGRHYQTCSLCNTKKYSSHNYTDLVCDECGRHLPVVTGTAGLEYTINEDNKSYSVTGLGTATATEITIASVYDGLPVTSIDNYAFEYCSSFTSIIIPDSVTSIGSDAFYNCNLLESISIPDSVTAVGSSAFTVCSSLESITIPDSVTSIGEGAFSGCSSLSSITIPKSVTFIGKKAFRSCTALESISVEDGNPKYHSAGNCIIETESKTLIAGSKNSVIPTDGSVTSIGLGAFFGCTSLTSITIPNDVSSIGDYAFYYCSSLTSITIPISVTFIGKWAFNGCSLTSIDFKGTKAQWNAIKKANSWNDNTGNYTIKCTDGNLDKYGNEIN